MNKSSEWQWLSRFAIVNMPIVATAMLSLALFGILLLVVVKGMFHFTVKPVQHITFAQTGQSAYGYIGPMRSDGRIEASVFVPVEREMSPIFLLPDDIVSRPSEDVYVIKTFSGKTLLAPQLRLQSAPFSEAMWQQSQARINEINAQIQAINEQSYPLEMRYAQYMAQQIPADAPVFVRVQTTLQALQVQRNKLQLALQEYQVDIQFDAEVADLSLPLADIALVWQPNKMSSWDKLAFSAGEIARFIVSDHTAKTGSAGVFPALFGTVLMVFLMTVVVMPIGVLTALYLHEYAPDNMVVTLVRVIIINLAGVPSIVYGVFGLGLFVLGLGVSIDELFYADSLPSPTFGAPGLLWAALTMALLTLPTVVVATEEGLSQVPDNLREGAMALGATKYEAIRYNVLPIASPNILTGAILAIARAASEVAPLLLVGAVIYAPTLPVDDIFPFVHLERQFMHLGVMIFDSVFHNQNNVEDGAMMYAICLLLIVVVLSLNALASMLRARLRARYERFS